MAGRDQLADELARCDAARDLAESDLESEATRLIELRATAAGFDAIVTERRAAGDGRRRAARRARRDSPPPG